jgi:hypothetical protein
MKSKYQLFILLLLSASVIINECSSNLMRSLRVFNEVDILHSEALPILNYQTKKRTNQSAQTGLVKKIVFETVYKITGHYDNTKRQMKVRLHVWIMSFLI